MNTGTIERDAVYRVSTYIERCPQLTPNIHFSDSNALVDGYITIYDDDAHKGNNDHILASVDVQVKGRTTIRLTNDGASFSEISRKGLKYYQRNGGCVIFLVRFIDKDIDKAEIYYRLLDVVYLDEILKNTTAEQPTFHLVPVPEKGEFTAILIEFDENRFKALMTLVKDNTERAKENPEIIKTDKNFSKDLLFTLHKLSELHNIPSRHKEAEELYIKTLSTFRELANTNLEYMKFVAMILSNLAHLHSISQKFVGTEKEIKEALVIFRELAKTNRNAYIADVAKTLNNFRGCGNDPQ